MTAARSWVRRGLASKPLFVQLTAGYEIEEAAIILGSIDGPMDSGYLSATGSSSDIRKSIWEIPTAHYRRGLVDLDLAINLPRMPPSSSACANIRTNLHGIMREEDPLFTLASRLGDAMQKTPGIIEQADLSDCIEIEPLGDRVTWRHVLLEGSWLKPISTGRGTSLLSFMGLSRYGIIRILGLQSCFTNGILKTLPDWVGKPVLYGCELGIEPINRNPYEYYSDRWPIFGMVDLMSQESRTPNDPGRSSMLPMLAIVSHESLPIQCALEIFARFMDAIASRTTTLGGLTERLSGTNPNDRREFISNSGLDELIDEFRKDPNKFSDAHDANRMVNSVLQDISNALVNVGLVKTIEEANVVVIPPFASRGLLPRQPGDIRVNIRVRGPR
ncbi:hypothetical protein AJ80_07338 [Polytolypa hystricis UAMH7299]|uniref:Uncharacterized protein n=1 Tax=Polytolypa hystricis (strain UAMH7299) TaxID=1447883 RepID=A0A2B7XPM8_POLH7|nr:hypothetical protein AJ80_07338 [Polytolypa hystricis UAMH7299]